MVLVSVGVIVEVAVAAIVFVGTGVSVLVATEVGLFVAAGVLVGVIVGVGVGGGWKPTTLTGVVRVVVVPSPSWPGAFRPQHLMPRPVVAHGCASIERLLPVATARAAPKRKPQAVAG